MHKRPGAGRRVDAPSGVARAVDGEQYGPMDESRPLCLGVVVVGGESMEPSATNDQSFLPADAETAQTVCVSFSAR